MKTDIVTQTLFALVLLLSPAAFGAPAALTDRQIGAQLVGQIWEAMKRSDMNAIDQILAEGFQSVHDYGAGGREAEKALIAKLKMSDYTISDLKVTRNGPVIVTTYRISVEETIKDERLTKTPASRMSVFVKTARGWQWIAHANLHPLQ